MPASLEFNIALGRLWGTANNLVWDLAAKSGGGGGSRLGDWDPKIVNNPDATGQSVDKKKGVRGGPIPVGRYKIHRPSRSLTLGQCALLDPIDACVARDNPATGRFYIHGQGLLGSDGCIVPLSRFGELMHALQSDGGGELRVS